MKNNTPFALKYRPVQFDDVVGQNHVTATLKKAVASQRVANAYLFAGHKGCGKTSSARIFATLLTCENVKDGKVCGECRPCKSIHAGYALDVKEADGASKGGVAEARKLIDSSYYAPQEFNKKVYIIDECHMLTTEANNALLKVVEEPPPYLTFIFCTTEPRKVIDTIISRCQRFNFRKISFKEISQKLVNIAKFENVNISEEACDFLAKLARGSMRDAIQYLDQISTLALDKNIGEKEARRFFGAADRMAIFDIVKSIVDGNIPLILDQVNDMILSYASCPEIIREISEVFRDMMVLMAMNDKENNVDLPDHEIKQIKSMTQDLKLGRLVKLAIFFSDIEKKMQTNINERWIMEAALLNCVAILRSKS